MANPHFYPPLEPFATGEMAVDEPHVLYWEQCGNPDGIPILFLHGGPGAGCTPFDRRFFDPGHFRIVLFDQRGCGRSRPVGELSNNSMADTTRDIEQLRELLGIERWHVFGGSYGSTIAWPELDWEIAPQSGHSSHEPEITRELVAATQRIMRTGSPQRD
jgi:proline iminopeptidase